MKRLEKERIYDFLAGLDMEYDPIRVQVLGRVPFPSLGEAYTIVQQEESRRRAMVHTPISDHSALVASPQGQFGSSRGFTPTSQNGKSQSGASSGSTDRESLQCDYCHNTGHTRDFCWKLHGRPPRGRGGGRGGRGRGTVRSQAQDHVSGSTVATSSDFGYSIGAQVTSEHTGIFLRGRCKIPGALWLGLILHLPQLLLPQQLPLHLILLTQVSHQTSSLPLLLFLGL